MEELKPSFLCKSSSLLLAELIANTVPAGIVRDLQGVFSIPEARKLILEEKREGRVTKRVSTAVFQINPMSCSEAL